LPTVSEPSTVAEVVELMRAASTAGNSVSIERLGGDVEMSMRRLGRVLEHEPGDLTCIVEAGIRLSELQEQLRPTGQMLMLDPPRDPTIGACLAGNLSGPRSHRYGAPRDLVLGVTVVLADGTVSSSGGRVVKNVAGYDLGKLFCGSRGRLGAIVRVALRLHAIPRQTASAAVAVADPAEAARLARAAGESQITFSALDLAWPGRLALLLEGSPAVVEQELALSRELLGCDQVDGVWEEIGRLQAETKGRVGFDPGQLGAFLAETQRAVVRVGAGAAYVPTSERPAWSPLAERIRVELDPSGVLAA
jgi:glycolate oxidase FAD binding subunit